LSITLTAVLVALRNAKLAQKNADIAADNAALAKHVAARADTTWELQRRPWLTASVEFCDPVWIDNGDTLYASIRVANHGQGSATGCVVNIAASRRANTSTEARELSSAGRAATIAFIPPNTSVHLSELGGYCPRPESGAQPMYLHIYCTFAGAETKRKYYFEQSLKWGSWFTNASPKPDDQFIFYRIVE
jgi:hypothetical protein